MKTHYEIQRITRQKLETEINLVKSQGGDENYLQLLLNELSKRNNPPPPPPTVEALTGCLEFVLITVCMMLMFVGWALEW